MIGARGRRIVAVVGRHDQHVGRPQLRQQAAPGGRRSARGSPRSRRRRCDDRRACRSPRGWRRSSPRAVVSIARSISFIPSSSLAVCTAAVMPRPAKRSSILPTATTGSPCPSPRRARSARTASARNRGGWPCVSTRLASRRTDARSRGRCPRPCPAMLVGDLAPPVELRRSGTTSSCAAIWNTLSAEV